MKGLNILNKLPIAICLGFFLAVSVACGVSSTSESLSGGIIRLHVRANSNSKEDQELKLKVRDRILKEAYIMKENGMDIDEVSALTKKSLEDIEKIASDEIAKNGYNYEVRAKYGKSRFPTREYGAITLPKGTYTALTVEIGTGKGDNWWCVMFPPLCFADETVAGCDPAMSDMLIDSLGKETYSMAEGGKTQIKFKVYEIIKGIDFGDIRTIFK